MTRRAAISPMKKGSDPNGIRTRVTAVKGRCPRPLDDRVTKPPNIPFDSSKATSCQLQRVPVRWTTQLPRRGGNGTSAQRWYEGVDQLGRARRRAAMFG